MNTPKLGARQTNCGNDNRLCLALQTIPTLVMLPILLWPLTTVTRLLSDDRSCDSRRDAATCSHTHCAYWPGTDADWHSGILMKYPDRIIPTVICSMLPWLWFSFALKILQPWSVIMLNGWIMIKLWALCVWVWWGGSTLSHVTSHAVRSHASRGLWLIHLLGNKGKWGKNGHFGEHWPLQCPIMNIIWTRIEDISWEMEKYRLQYLISETLDLNNQGTITVHCS